MLKSCQWSLCKSMAKKLLVIELFVSWLATCHDYNNWNQNCNQLATSATEKLVISLMMTRILVVVANR